MSAFISPSTSNSGYWKCRISTAFEILAASGSVSVPKFECDSIAITGSIPKLRTVWAAISTMLTRSSTVGLGLTAVSAKNIGPRLVVTISIAASVVLLFVVKIWRTGFSASV